MLGIKRSALAVALSLLVLGGGQAAAQEVPSNSPLADGKLSKKELAAFVLTAEQQLTLLAETATKEYLPVIEGQGVTQPQAWMLMKDGETVKRIDLKGQAEGAPSEIQAIMYGAAIKSLARRGLINAAAVLYSGQVNEGDETQALIIEHEHRLGVSANKVVGYVKENGVIVWGKPVTVKKPFEWFYDAKKDPS